MTITINFGRRAAPAVFAATFVLGLFATASAQAAGDAAKGQAAFKAQCAVCHATTAGTNKIGPSLSGVGGRRAGTAPKFNYSAAMKNSGKTWNASTLDAYLTKPSKVVPGTRMAYAGQANTATRQDIIAYLFSLK